VLLWRHERSRAFTMREADDEAVEVCKTDGDWDNGVGVVFDEFAGMQWRSGIHQTWKLAYLSREIGVQSWCC
jgi:hypothetical protein